MHSRIPFQSELIAILIGTRSVQVFAQPAIPEPPVVFYGQVNPTSPAPELASVMFTLTRNSDTITTATATPARVVTVEGVSWYLVTVPFETRVIQGGPSLPTSPGALVLTAEDTTYSLSAKVGSQDATLPVGKTTFVYGAQSQGLIDRIDLTLGGETFAQWSQRIFGCLVSQTDDADGDGRSNYDEYLAGTDPQNPNSRLAIASFAPVPGGGFSLTWDTVAGRTYQVERSSNLTPGQWTNLQSGISGDGSPKTYTDNSPGTATRLFYRIAVIKTP